VRVQLRERERGVLRGGKHCSKSDDNTHNVNVRIRFKLTTDSKFKSQSKFYKLQFAH
jgi:hypothetical protein